MDDFWKPYLKSSRLQRLQKRVQLKYFNKAQLESARARCKQQERSRNSQTERSQPLVQSKALRNRRATRVSLGAFLTFDTSNKLKSASPDHSSSSSNTSTNYVHPDLSKQILMVLAETKTVESEAKFTELERKIPNPLDSTVSVSDSVQQFNDPLINFIRENAAGKLPQPPKSAEEIETKRKMDLMFDTIDQHAREEVHKLLSSLGLIRLNSLCAMIHKSSQDFAKYLLLLMLFVLIWCNCCW